MACRSIAWVDCLTHTRIDQRLVVLVEHGDADGLSLAPPWTSNFVFSLDGRDLIRRDIAGKLVFAGKRPLMRLEQLRRTTTKRIVLIGGRPPNSRRARREIERFRRVLTRAPCRASVATRSSRFFVARAGTCSSSSRCPAPATASGRAARSATTSSAWTSCTAPASSSSTWRAAHQRLISDYLYEQRKRRLQQILELVRENRYH